MPLGFILQPTYRIERNRPVVLLYGLLEDGGSFLIRETRQRPHFFIRQADTERARRLGANPRPDSRRRVTLRDEPLAVVEVALPQDAPALRDRLTAASIACFEADVRFAYRYLIERGIRGTLAIDGAARRGEGVDAVFDDPTVTPADWTPTPTVLSLDIETDPRAQQLLSVALCGCGTQEVLLRPADPALPIPPGVRAFPDERSLLQALTQRIRELDPDILTGWNVVDFDLAVLSRLAHRHGVALALGRGPAPLRVRAASGPRGSGQALVPGRVVLDGIDLLRGSFVRVESYALGAVARQFLGRSKTIGGSDRAAEILRQWREDVAAFCEYNLQDAQLVLDIFDHLNLIELTVERCRLTGMPPDRVAASIASFDLLYLSELTRRGRVAPTAAPGGSAEVATAGGHVLDPLPGLYRNVMVLDFKSLYPSLIRTFQIDPLGWLPEPDADPIVAPNGAAFARQPGILPGMLDDLFPRREAARAAGDAVTSQAIKILMNSFYGVLGTSACRFAHPELANAITSFGREILLWTKAGIEALGHEVLYGDTDSLFVLTGSQDEGQALTLAQRIVERLNRELTAHVAATWRVVSRLELEFERLYLRLLLPEARHGTRGARKRYAGLVRSGDSTRVVFTGMEVVRRDWTDLARRVQRELHERLFHDRPVEAYVREIVAELRAGRLDASLVYRKALRKRLDSYTASIPPHVVAARKLGGKPRRSIRYVITVDGPEPAENPHARLDHEHYVQRQVRAVAEPVLRLLGLEFDRVVGDDTQLRLF